MGTQLSLPSLYNSNLVFPIFVLDIGVMNGYDWVWTRACQFSCLVGSVILNENNDRKYECVHMKTIRKLCFQDISNV